MSTKLKAGTATSGAVIDADTTGILELQSGSTPTTAITIDASQNVGIGTSSPSYKTSILNSGTGVIAGFGTAGVQGLLTVSYDTTLGESKFEGSSFGTTCLSAPSTNAVTFKTNATERMRIDSSGNLMVGTTSLLNSYNVPGSIHSLTTDAKQLNLRNSNATAGRVWTLGMTNASEFIVYANAATGVYLNWNATSWTASSDERLKADLKPIENAVEKVKTLRTVTGRFKTDEENVSRAFLIAQDVQKVLPEAVDERNDENKTLGLRYQDIVPLLTAAIKEQQAMIEELNAKVEAQAAEIAVLKGAK